MQVKKQRLESDMNNGLVPNSKKSTSVLYCHPAYLSYMQSTSCEMPGCMNHKLESRLLGETSVTCDTTIMAESKEELKSLLMKEESQKGERGESKS